MASNSANLGLGAVPPNSNDPAARQFIVIIRECRYPSRTLASCAQVYKACLPNAAGRRETDYAGRLKRLCITGRYTELSGRIAKRKPD